jgi:hypothetical protein
LTVVLPAVNMKHHIAKERKEIGLHMSLELDICDKDIRRLTGISERSMQRIRKNNREIGEVVRIPVCQGRPRLLDSLEANVSHACMPSTLIFKNIYQFLEGCIEHQPDMMLLELQEHLREVCDVEASTATISRTLSRRGFILKRVQGEGLVLG